MRREQPFEKKSITAGQMASRQKMEGKKGHSDHPTAILCRPIAELKLDPKNPRSHGRQQVRQIARSIEVFGFNVPV
jgi:hypothetical protein